MKILKNPKAFIDYSETIDDVYERLEDYNPKKKRRVLIVFDGTIAVLESNKKSLKSPIVTVIVFKRKNSIFYLFLYQKVPKTIRPNATHYFIMKIPNKRELQQIVSNHLSDIDFKDFMKLYKDYTKEPYLFLVKDTTLSSDNPLTFRKNLL